MEVEKRSSKGGFLQLFDWNTKSRKKLFSNKPDAPESSKQGKENVDSLAISRLQQMKLDDGIRGNDWASSMINDEGSVTKAPGVVARLMGLESLPTFDYSDPSSTPFIDSHSFRHSFITTDFETEHQYVEYTMRNKLDGFSRNPVEDRLQKLQNRPIERFQTEPLPPRSAKSVPITHHKMLSPIKSPGFVLSRNAAYIMEAASRMNDQSPQSTHNQRLPSFRSSSSSSSIPLRIRDLKEKMEAEQRTSRIHESSQRSKACTPVSSSREVVLLKNKNKPNAQKYDGLGVRNRASMKQKEDGLKSDKLVQLDKKQRVAPKGVLNKPTTGKSKTSDVLTPNNQKQNCVSQSHKDRTSLKPRVPYQHYRKTTSTNGKEVKTSKKTVENSARRTTKSFSGKKRQTDGSNTNSVVIKEKESSVKCNITIVGSSNWESVDRKDGMDVVSFTFTSPIKKPGSEAELTGQPGVKSRGLRLKFDDHVNTGTSEAPAVVTPVIDSDALSVLLEQKLKEISSIVETSQCKVANGGSTMHKDRSFISHDSDVSVDQGVEVTECDSNSENYESGINIKHPCTSPSLEPSLTDDSCITSNSTTTLTSNGNKQFTSPINMEQLLEEIDLQDSATSNPTTTIFEFTSRAKWSFQPESEYIREILNHAELALDFALNPTQNIINDNLFDYLESQNKNMDPFLKPQRKALFDCVSMCLESRRERAYSGSYKEWSKWSTLFSQKEALLVVDIEKEIRGWAGMEELMVDEVVEKDMSIGNGNWLDFEAEALEEGEVIEIDILTVLIDEMVVDLLSC